MGDSPVPRIITADCSFPREIDDGLFVHPLDEDHELYRVGVCVVDTSKLYQNQEVVKQAFDRTTAKYWDLPNGERGYDPMIEPDIIKGIEFTAGNVRDALVISFLVGKKVEPSEVGVTFGQVKIVRNITYKEFAKYAEYGDGERFSKASNFIKGHLGYIAYGDHVGTQPQWREDESTPDNMSNSSASAWKKGSKMNEAFMVAANHLVGKALQAEGWPAIYRVHDPQDERHIELVSSSVALYSRIPGPHSGLGLDPYCRITSPLRRLDDFVMNHQLKRRFLGKTPADYDAEQVAWAVRRLNQEVIASAPKEASRVSRRDILGRTASRLALVPAIGE